MLRQLPSLHTCTVSPSVNVMTYMSNKIQIYLNLSFFYLCGASERNMIFQEARTFLVAGRISQIIVDYLKLNKFVQFKSNLTSRLHTTHYCRDEGSQDNTIYSHHAQISCRHFEQEWYYRIYPILLCHFMTQNQKLRCSPETFR